MSNPIQASPPPAAAGIKQSKLSSMESVENPASSDDSTDFMALLASAESEVDLAEPVLAENLFETIDDSILLGDSTPMEYRLDGNSLPAEEQAALWQAMLLVQPTENVSKNSTLPQLQSVSLFESKSQPVLMNPELFKQDYFNSLTTQSKGATSTSLPAGFAANNINMQLAAAQFNPDTNETLLLNIEQLQPAQGVSSTLSQGLAAVGLGTATQAATTQTQMAPLNLGQNAWESNLGSRLQMMVGQNIQTAEIRLDPPELGALDIKIKITNDVASVNITSAHSQVREALETAVPKLREMFAENGVELGDVNVRQESFTQQQNTSEEGKGLFKQTAESELGDEQDLVTRKIVSDNLLDIYA